MHKNLLLHFVILPYLFISFIMNDIKAQEAKVPYDVFSFEQELNLPGKPELIYDAITGDISAWWDHSFSEHPYKLFIEAKPGGGFYEIFNEEGDGVKHATVIYADRGKLLRFEGPLGLSGRALQLVCTYTFTEKGSDSTNLKLSVHGAGEVEKGVPELVAGVWQHFLFERFKPYIESGEYSEKYKK
jgi:hypothetical protein